MSVQSHTEGMRSPIKRLLSRMNVGCTNKLLALIIAKPTPWLVYVGKRKQVMQICKKIPTSNVKFVVSACVVASVPS